MNRDFSSDDGACTSEKFAWLHSLWLTALIFGLVLLFLERRYDYIDDLSFRDYFQQDVALLFSANVLRQLAVFLYRHLPAVPWWGVILYACQFLAVWVCVDLLLLKDVSKNVKIIFGILFLSTYLPFLMRASYNFSSILPGGIAIIAFISTLQRKAKPGLWKCVLLGILLAISFIIRRDGYKVAGAYLLPPLLALLGVAWLVKRIQFRQYLIYGVCFVLFFAPLIAVQILDEYQYQATFTPAEQFHRTSNRSRSPVMGWYYENDMVRHLDLMDANGWNRNDLLLAAYGLNFLDENKFAAEKFYNIFDPQMGLTLAESKKSFFYNLLHFGQSENFTWYVDRWQQPEETWLYWPYHIAMLAVTVFVLWRGKHLWDQLFAVSFLGYVYLLEVYMTNYMRFPRHAAIPPLVLFSLALFFCTEVKDEKLVVGWRNLLGWSVVLLLVAVAAGSFVVMVRDLNTEIIVKRARFFSIYHDLAQRLGNEAWMIIRPQLYLEIFADPLGDQGPVTHHAALGVSNAAYSPVLYTLLKKYGLSYGYQILPWMVDHSNAYLISTEEKLVGWMENFIYNTYGILADARPVYVYPDGLTIYRFVGIDVFVPGFQETYNFLDNLSAAQVETDNPAYVRASEFNMRGDRRKVLFQHPPAVLSYRVDVPQAAYLRFSTALSSEVWQTVGGDAGDGVDFRIYIESAAEKSLVFSNYIDPKTELSDRRWHENRLDLSSWAGQTVTITFQTDPGPQGDARFDWAGWAEPALGQVTRYDFTQKFYLAEPVPASFDLARVRRIKVENSYQNSIFEHAPGWLSYPVQIEPDARLEFKFGLDPVVWSADTGDGVEFEILVTVGDTTYQIFSKYVDPKNNVSDRRWFDESLDLSRFAGQNVRINLVTHPGPSQDARNDWAYWIAPRLVKAVSHVQK